MVSLLFWVNIGSLHWASAISQAIPVLSVIVACLAPLLLLVLRGSAGAAGTAAPSDGPAPATQRLQLALRSPLCRGAR